MSERRPNVIFVFGDQWRGQATGYAGDPNVRTPVLDRLAAQSVNFTQAVAGFPVCCPYRASMITGQHALTHGVFLNDLPLRQHGPSIAHCFGQAGYDTAWVGKWHLEGHGRAAFIPREHRQGFQFWKALECTHSYNQSYCYGDTPEKLMWPGYDAHAQTREAIRYIRDRSGGRDAARPFLLCLSWGPPHGPYGTAPAEYRAMYDPARLVMAPNVPEQHMQLARTTLAGYYAHISALDTALGWLLQALDEAGIAEDTLLVFTSDHGDFVGSHGTWDKQRPYEECVRVPFLLRWPALLGRRGRETTAPIDAQDIMPTLLSLCGLEVPHSVEGLDYAGHVRGGPDPGDGAAVLLCPVPFGNWPRKSGGREFRGLRTARHTYVRTLDGPWLLFDNASDPYQLDNLAGRPEHAALQARLDAHLDRKLAERGDEFLPAAAYLERWGYELDEGECILRIHGEEVPGARGYSDAWEPVD